MNYFSEDLIFAFGLTFRILFYSFLISLMFFENIRMLKKKYNKYINILIVFFALCYIGSLIPILWSDKNYGGSPEFMLIVWVVFFIYILIFNNLSINKFEFNKTISYILVKITIVIILLCNVAFNFHSYRGTWYGDFNTEIFHGIASFLLPICSYRFSVIKPKSISLGWFTIIVTLLLFILGIMQSYGIDGYISDDTEFSIIFITNTIIFLTAGLYNIFYSKTKKDALKQQL